MGQEIVHCSTCGIRLRSSDFERGAAVRRDSYTYCRDCALKAGISAEPTGPSKSSGVSASRIPVVNPTSTTRIPTVTPRRPVEAVPAASVPPALIWGGVALVVVVLLLAGLMLGGGSRRPAAPEPEAPRPAAAAAPSPRTPAPAPRETNPAASKPKSTSTESADRATLERRVAEAVARERFREALDLLDAERKRHDSLEWTSSIQRVGREVDASVKKLYQELQATMDAARRRGAETEAQATAARIAGWGLPGYPAVPVPAPDPVAAAPAAAPAPEPAPAPAAPAAPAAASSKPLPIPFTPGPQKWTLLTSGPASATSAARLTPVEDGSILVDGESSERVRYSVVVQTDLKAIAAFRLEVLPDPSLAGSGPGRNDNGNFVLSEFQVQLLPDPKAASGTPLAFERAAADHAQDGFSIENVLDGKNDTGWAILPRTGRAHEAIFELRVPLSSQNPLTLLFILDHQSIYGWHSIGRFRLSASSAKGAASEFLSRPPPPVDQGPVDVAIRRGLDWLLKSGSPGTEIKERKTILTCDELLLLTFLHCGVAETDARFQQILASVLAGPYTHTYTVALRAMALEELDRVRYQSHIARCAQFLLDNQLASGQWSYGEPSVAVDAIRADVPSATPAALKPGAAPRPKPKVGQKIGVRPTRTPAGNGDFSNAQYAALGLRACVDAGIVIPKEVFVRAQQAFVAAQLVPTSPKDGTPSLPAGRKPRGWCYDSPCACPLHRPYGTVSAGAVGSLAIYDHLLGRDPKKDAALQDGVAWLQVNYAVDTVPGPIEWDKISKTTYLPYYLYALERAMILTGNERLGTRTWYSDGVRVFLDNQRADGSWALDDWGKDTWDTCFALLFLKRSTRPLVASTDRFHPPDDDKK